MDSWNLLSNPPLITLQPYSSFLNSIVSFLCVGISLWGLAHFYQLFSTDPIIKHTKKCKYCKKRVNEMVRPPCL